MSVLAAILAVWVLAGGVAIGLGWLLRRASGLAGLDPRTAPDAFDAFWLGFAATVAVLQVWHLVFPINAWLVLVVALAGWVGLSIERPWSVLSRVPRRDVLLASGLLIVGAVWLGLMGLRPLEIYDAGLYHLQAVEWNGTYPAVPGLGNLHGRLAFNSSYFLVLALFNQGPLAGAAYRATAGLIVLVFFAQVVHSISTLARARQASTADWLLILMAVPVAAVVGANGVATTSTDLPVFPLQVLIAYQLVRWLNHLDAPRGGWYLAQAAALSATAVTIKLSSAGFVAGCAVLALAVMVHSRRWPNPVLAAAPLGLAAVLVAGWVANGVVLSGFPLYPSTLLPFPVDWRVTNEQAQLDASGILLFARQPGALNARTFEGWGWFPDWLAANSRDLAPPAVAVVWGLLVLVWFRSRGSDAMSGGLLVLVPVWVGLGVWFLTAPAPRFAGALPWLAAAIPVAVVQARGRSRLSNLALIGFALGAIVPPQPEQLSLVFRAPVAAVRRGMSSVPITSMRVFVTDSGLRLYVPSDSELAWAGPLPSTPTPNRHLRPRCPDDLACGFTLDRAS